MSVWQSVVDKLTTRNFMAITFSATFLYAVIVTVNQEVGVSLTNGMVSDLTTTEALLIGTIGGGIGGVFFKMVSDMVQFYFRASGKKSEVKP
jgi:hypothetical protein